MTHKIKSCGLVPCKTCPWRVERDATTIPRYDSGLAHKLLETVGEEDGFYKVMACHGSTDKTTVPCKGYLAQVGWKNIMVRLMVSQGVLPDPYDVRNACVAKGIKLESNYQIVLEKMEASVA